MYIGPWIKISYSFSVKLNCVSLVANCIYPPIFVPASVVVRKRPKGADDECEAAAREKMCVRKKSLRFDGVRII